MPTVDLWGVLNGIKSVAAVVFDSRILLTGLCVSAGFGIFGTFWNFWTGWTIPTVAIDSAFYSEFSSDLSDTILYCVHADYALRFYNFFVTVINVVVPFVLTSAVTFLLFRFAINLKNSIGRDIRVAS